MNQESTKKLVPDVTAGLAAFAAGLKYEDIPSDVEERCRMFILDAIGIMFGAANFARNNDDHCLQNYLDAVAPPGGNTVFGYRVRTTPLMAAFANGTMMEVLDCQDSNMKAEMHSGSGTIPAVLALSEAYEERWNEIVPAIVAGYEVHTRLVRSVQPGHWHSGFQATGTFGTCGAATAAGRLFGFDQQQMAAALGISGFVMPVSNGDNQFKGHSIKPVHGGQAAMSGLSAAYMAQAGYRAGLLEGEPPRYHAPLQMLGKGPNYERTISEFNETWYARDVYFKPYPIGGLIIGPVEVALGLVAERKIDIAAIESIDIRSFMHAVMFTGKKYTSTQSNYVDAHLSIPYCVAVSLMDGEMTPRQLSKERLSDPKVHELASRVTCTEDSEMTKGYPEYWPVKIALRMRDGTNIMRSVDAVRWSPLRPATYVQLAEKFHAMTDPVIGSRRADNAVNIIAELRESSTLAPLFAELQVT